MECPKCHNILSENTLVCPHCHKVLALSCPNCNTINSSPICSKCGYIILEKCNKCGRMVPTTQEKCKCGFSVKKSIAYNECEIDDFASLIINFGGLNNIRRRLESQELYAKFLVKLKNLMAANLKDIDGHAISYNNVYNVNFNKELSFATSVNKAVKLALKIINSFAALNSNIVDKLGASLKMTIIVLRKNAEDLLVNKSFNSNLKLMIKKKEDKSYLKGMQIILDQYCQDKLKDYKTDSLYSLEREGTSIMFYEVLLENYIVPPNEDKNTNSNITPHNIKKAVSESILKNDLYGFNVFDINAKCTFTKSYSEALPTEINLNNKILAIRTKKEFCIKTSDIAELYESMGFKAIYVSCTEELKYKPWGLFEKIFKAYFNLSVTSGLINPKVDTKMFNTFKKFILGHPEKISKSDNARFKYLEQFVKFLTHLKRCVIIVDGFENIDDSSIEALKLFFDKYAKIYINFVFITDAETSVHSKIKNLLQTFLYKEVTLVPTTMDSILSDIKDDASDFIQSFYYEKIKENFKGSKIYFEHAIKYLMDKDVLTNFEKRLIIKNNSSFMVPKDLTSLIRTRLKTFTNYPDASMILAYSVYLGERLDFATLEALGINNIKENCEFLDKTGFTFTRENSIFINNYNLIRPMIQSSLKKEVEEFLIKNIIGKIGKLIDNTTLMLLMGQLSMLKEEAMMLWKNAQMSIECGDYDAYLKNCLGYLSVIENIGDNIPKESIENNKKEIFKNILMSLFAYSPSKIYAIENILLSDAIESEDDEQIMKLSNLMLQGALISSNYTDALSLLHNIFEKMPNTSFIVNGAINTKYILLSLVNIEILFNIGDYRDCIDIAGSILDIIKPNIIEKIKPASFSKDSFLTHLAETFRLAGIAKIIANDSDFESFIVKIEKTLEMEFPDKDSLLALKEFLAGKDCIPSKTELMTPFSKLIFLILKELPEKDTNPKAFAQNIYQAKLLASDIHQTQIEYICDLLIGYAYSQIGISQKADTIIQDILEKTENSSIYNIAVIAKYILVKNKLKTEDIESAILLINDTLANIQKRNNQAQVFYALFEKLFTDIAIKYKIQSIDIDSELKKLIMISPNGELERIVKIRDSQNGENDNQTFIEENKGKEPDTESRDDNNLKTETH